MISGMGKMRPMGHNHHYKYAHSRSLNDIQKVTPNYKQDGDSQGTFEFNLDNMTGHLNSAFANSEGVKNLVLNLPYCSTITSLCNWNTSVENIKIYAPKVTLLNFVCYHAISLKSFDMNTSNITSLNGFSETTNDAYDWTGFDFSKVTNATYGFLSQSVSGVATKIFDAEFPSLETANYAFYNLNINELKYPVNKDGICIYRPEVTDKEIAGYKYVEFPKLTNATRMFTVSELDKNTTLSILNSLPTYTSGTHEFGIGIHADLKYDLDVNIAIKNCQNSFAAPLDSSLSLTPFITANKGWTMRVDWNGTETIAGSPLKFENISESDKSLLRSATKIIDNNLYDANGNSLGVFKTERLLTGSNIIFDANGSSSSSDGKEKDLLFSTVNPSSGETVRTIPLTTFSSNLSILGNGYGMFCFNSLLTSFKSDLKALTNGDRMFRTCTSLTSFTGDLRSLTNGDKMFSSCKLNAASVKNIINTIKSVSSGKLGIGLGCNDTSSDKDLFAQEAGYSNMSALLAALQNKGWTLEVAYNGRPS